MPMTVKVGLAQKVGQPDYGSLGASCEVSLELDAGLLFSDFDGFHRKIQTAYVACRQAVQDELANRAGAAPLSSSQAAIEPQPARALDDERGSEGRSSRTNPNRDSADGANGSPNVRSANGSRRAATSAQVRALHSISTRQNFKLADLLRDRFHIYKAEELSLREASQLIDELNASRGSRA